MQAASSPTPNSDISRMLRSTAAHPFEESAQRVGSCEPYQFRCAEAGSSVCCDFTESAVLFPIHSRVANLFRRARDEVPPHENCLWEGWATDQQQPGTGVAADRHFRTLCPEIVKHAPVKALPIERALPAQDEDSVFVAPA